MPSPLSFQGPSQSYNSYIDGLRASTSSSKYGHSGAVSAAPESVIDFLLQELNEIQAVAEDLYRSCLYEMRDYTLRLDTSDEVLMKSHAMSYPEDETPDSVSFKEYIYNFGTSSSTSSSYVNRYYENKVRGIYGTNALDIAHVAKVTSLEIERIKKFLDDYTGEIDDPSEFKTIDSFESWAEDSKKLLQAYRATFQAKGLAGIPADELDEIDETKAREFQGLFQSKLNIINSAIHDQISQLYKDWNNPSTFFYDKVLGPSLKFSLKVGKNITSGLDPSKAPLLHKEADMTKLGMTAQFQSALSDQKKRNQLYYQHLERLIQNILQRDTYIRYMDQLSSKGAILPNPFMTQYSDEPIAFEEASHLLSEIRHKNFDENASSGHDFLTGREDPEAHPQYVLKTGDLIHGDLEVYGDFKLNGQNLSSLFDVDSDGNVVVKTDAIDWSNVDSSQLYGAGDASRPKNISINNRRILSDGKIEYTIDFGVEENNIASYEFEIIEL